MKKKVLCFLCIFVLMVSCISPCFADSFSGNVSPDVMLGGGGDSLIGLGLVAGVVLDMEKINSDSSINEGVRSWVSGAIDWVASTLGSGWQTVKDTFVNLWNKGILLLDSPITQGMYSLIRSGYGSTDGLTTYLGQYNNDVYYLDFQYTYSFPWFSDSNFYYSDNPAYALVYQKGMVYLQGTPDPLRMITFLAQYPNGNLVQVVCAPFQFGYKSYFHDGQAYNEGITHGSSFRGSGSSRYYVSYTNPVSSSIADVAKSILPVYMLTGTSTPSTEDWENIREMLLGTYSGAGGGTTVEPLSHEWSEGEDVDIAWTGTGIITGADIAERFGTSGQIIESVIAGNLSYSDVVDRLGLVVGSEGSVVDPSTGEKTDEDFAPPSVFDGTILDSFSIDLSLLGSKLPFSAIYTIGDVFSVCNTPAVTPNFDLSFPTGLGTYETYHLDLADFNEGMSILRTTEVVSFCIFLLLSIFKSVD